MTNDQTELDKAIREVVTASYEMFADHAIDQAVEELYARVPHY